MYEIRQMLTKMDKVKCVRNKKLIMAFMLHSFNIMLAWLEDNLELLFCLRKILNMVLKVRMEFY